MSDNVRKSQISLIYNLGKIDEKIFDVWKLKKIVVTKNPPKTKTKTFQGWNWSQNILNNIDTEERGGGAS